MGYNKFNKILRECRARDIPCITDATREYILDFLHTHQPITCIEVGCGVWYSLLTRADALQARWGSIWWYEWSIPNVIEISIAISWYNNVTITHADGRYIVPPKQIHRAFLDGAKAQYVDYLQAILPYMAPWSYIMCDDVIAFRHKLDQLYSYLQKNQLSYHIVSLSDDDGICVIKTA